MKTGIYKSPNGEELNVIEVDEENKKVLVDYGNGETTWWGEGDYQYWTSTEETESEPIPEEQPQEEAQVEKPPKKKAVPQKKTVVKKPAAKPKTKTKKK